MMRQTSSSMILFLFVAALFCCGLSSAANDLCFVKERGEGSLIKVQDGKECRPLRIMIEKDIGTDVGTVCATFVDEESLKITFDTEDTGYVLVNTLHVYYGPDAAHVPSNEAGKPDPDNFEYQVEAEAGTTTASMEVKVDPMGTMACPSTTLFWNKILVSHATVQLADGTGNPISVYGHEGFLYKFKEVDKEHTDYYSWWQVDLSCQCSDPTTAPTSPPTVALTSPPTVGIVADLNPPKPNSNVTSIIKGDDDLDISTEAPTTTAPTTDAPSLSPVTSAPTEPTATTAPTLTPTTTAPTTNTEPKQLGSATPSSSPTFAPSVEIGEDLVLGMSFIVVTAAASTVQGIPFDMVQNSFRGFAQHVMDELQVPPLPASQELPAPEGGLHRRKLSVQYHNSSLSVYQLLVNMDDCMEEATSIAMQQLRVSKQATPQQAQPIHSYCHRAYSKMTVRIVNEDPIVVCDTIRNGTLAAFELGYLEEAKRQLYPQAPLQLMGGEFEYCVPISQFGVVEDEEQPNWTHDENVHPLANLTTASVEENDSDNDDDKAWLWPLIIAMILLVSCCTVVTLVALRKKQEQNEEEEQDGLMS